jgi:thiamine transporter ThiT
MPQKVAVEPSLISLFIGFEWGFYEGGYNILGILSLMGLNVYLIRFVTVVLNEPFRDCVGVRAGRSKDDA